VLAARIVEPPSPPEAHGIEWAAGTEREGRGLGLFSLCILPRLQQPVRERRQGAQKANGRTGR